MLVASWVHLRSHSPNRRVAASAARRSRSPTRGRSPCPTAGPAGRATARCAGHRCSPSVAEFPRAARPSGPGLSGRPPAPTSRRDAQRSLPRAARNPCSRPVVRRRPKTSQDVLRSETPRNTGDVLGRLQASTRRLRCGPVAVGACATAPDRWARRRRVAGSQALRFSRARTWHRARRRDRRGVFGRVNLSLHDRAATRRPRTDTSGPDARAISPTMSRPDSAKPFLRGRAERRPVQSRLVRQRSRLSELAVEAARARQPDQAKSGSQTLVHRDIRGRWSSVVIGESRQSVAGERSLPVVSI